MRLTEIRRYPIKSLLGERLATVLVEQRGLAGDRVWAVRDAEGKLGSGKNTRRFRRVPGLFSLRGHGSERVPVVELPDGRRFDADDPAGHKAISKVLDRVVTVAPEAEVPHHDEGPVSIITTAALRQLGELVGQPVDPARFRANLLVDTTDVGFVEDEWLGHTLNVGPDVVLVPRRCLTRCVMIDMAQDQLPHDGRLLKTLTRHNAMMFGVWATVERAGRISIGDRVTVGNA